MRPWSVHHMLSLPLYSLWRGLHPLLQCGISPMGDSPPWASPMCVSPKVYNSSLTVPAGVCFMGRSPSRMGHSSMDPPRGRKPASKRVSEWTPLHRSTGSCQEPALT